MKHETFYFQTDDFGVFDTNLSREIGLTAVHHNLSNKDLIKIMQQSIDFSFASATEKKELRAKLEKFIQKQKVWVFFLVIFYVPLLIFKKPE